MKKYFIFVWFILSVSTSYAQSGWQRSFLADPNYYTSIVKPDANNIMAFTFYSDLSHRSTNAGLSWSAVKSFDTNCIIRDSDFIDPLTGYCVGQGPSVSDGKVYKTTNGGNSWVKQNITGYPSWWCVEFSDSNTVWVGGLQGVVLRSTNGGINWIPYTIPNLREVRDIKFIDKNTGWICGRGNMVIKTTNAGNNWITQGPITTNEYGYIMSLYLFNKDTCWITGSYVDTLSTLRNIAVKTPMEVLTGSGSMMLLMKVHSFILIF